MSYKKHADKGQPYVQVYCSMAADADLLDCSVDARLLAVLSLLHAADQGTHGLIPASPRRVNRFAFLSAEADVDAALRELLAIDYLVPVDGDDAHLRIRSWDRYQVDLSADSPTRSESNRRKAFIQHHNDGKHTTSRDGCVLCDADKPPKPVHPSTDDPSTPDGTAPETAKTVNAALWERFDKQLEDDAAEGINPADTYLDLADLITNRAVSKYGHVKRVTETTMLNLLVSHAVQTLWSKGAKLAAGVERQMHGLRREHGTAVTLDAIVKASAADSPAAYCRTTLENGGSGMTTAPETDWFPPFDPGENDPGVFGRVIPPADMHDLARKLAADLELRLEYGSDAIAGESVGFREFDTYLMSEAGRMFLLGGGPGSGKTALALDMARHVATRQCVVDAATGRTQTGKVLYVLTEMTPMEMLTRMVQGFAGLTTAELKRRVTSDVVEKANEALRRLRDAGVILVDASEGDIDDVIATMDHAKAVHGDALRMVFFDNMSMVEHSKRNRRNADQHLRVADSAQKLKRCAQRNKFPLWVVAHTKRKQTAGRYRPGLEDFAETSKLERISDSAVILTEKLNLGEGDIPFAGVGDPFAGGPQADEGFAWRELYVVKNRGEKNGFVIDLKFVGAEMRFEEPNGPTWRPYQVPNAENARVAEFRAKRRELDL